MADDASQVLEQCRTAVLMLLMIAAGSAVGDVGGLGTLDLDAGLSDSSTSRHLLASPWTSSAPDRICWPSYDGNCRAGDFALLASTAPAPTSLGGRLLLKTLGQGYQCWAHQTIDSCQSDKDNRCTWLTDSSVCNTNSTTQLLTVREALLCPGSLAEQLFQCSIKLKEQECDAVPECSWSLAATACIPATVAKMAAEELERLLPSVGKLDASVWGCCEGLRILKAMMACSTAESLTECIQPYCKWDFSAATCSLSQQGLLEKVLAKEESELLDYIQQSDSACGVNPGNLGACGSNNIFDIDLAKVVKYASWVPSKEERGSCGGDLINGATFTPESSTPAGDGLLVAGKNSTGEAVQFAARTGVNESAVATSGKKMVVFSGVQVLVVVGLAAIMSMFEFHGLV